MNNHNHPARSVELSGELHGTTLYNCLRHYILDAPQGAKIRVKALKVRGAFPGERCLGRLLESLGDGWHQAQEHPHIATIGFCTAVEPDLLQLNPLPVVIIMQEYQNGNILDHINRVGAPHPQRAQWLLEAASALQFLHEEVGIIHGNVHTNNILIDANGGALLADPAVYTSIRRHFGTGGILPYFHLPDSLSCKPAKMVDDEFRSTNPTIYDDTFAFAVTAWITFNGNEPFREYNPFQTVIKISRFAHKELKKVPGMSDGIWELISVILSQDSTRECPALSDIVLELRELVLASGSVSL